MSKNSEPHRLHQENYPHQLVIETQFGDMDAYGHINNLAIGRYFESARARIQLDLYADRKLFEPGAEYVILLAENNMRFLAECSFPDPVTVGTAVGRIGNSSYQFLHALFQNGHCVSLCEAIMVCTSDGRPVAIPDQVRVRMQSVLIRNAV